MPNAHVKVPSAWRIIRAHLAVRESSTFNDIYEAVKAHRPNYNRKRFENKLTHMRGAGIIRNKIGRDQHGNMSAIRGVYVLTQEGRRDITDPEELHGLPEHDGKTDKSKAQKERDAATRKVPCKGERNGENLIKARAKLAEMRANGAMKYRKKPGRPKAKTTQTKAKDVRIIQSRAAEPVCPVVKIAGEAVPVDQKLVNQLLAAKPANNGEQELIVPFSTDIKLRLKVVVELA